VMIKIQVSWDMKKPKEVNPEDEGRGSKLFQNCG
jgi:hypothetical protein